MTLFLSKLLPIFVDPLGLVIVLGLVAFVRGKRIGRAVLALAHAARCGVPSSPGAGARVIYPRSPAARD